MPASSWEREPALRHRTTSTPDATAISLREWIPASFRKSRAFPLAILCLLFVVCLEVLDILARRNHGLPADNQNSFHAAKYLPTIGVVALGFAWKALVGDIKNITPWSQMSIKWSKGSHSVLLDYITNIEVTSLIHAGRNGHWLVFAALTIGFLCGASVSLANSLVFIDLFSHTSVDTTFTEASQFSFNNALELSNGTLPIPFDHLGAAPYAAVASQRLPNGRFAPWTKDVFAFDSFGAASENLPRNSTVEATVKAFSTDFNCHSLNYSWEDGDFYHQLEADASDIPGLNCSLPIRQNFTTESDSPLRTNVKAWLNVTACAPKTTENLLIGTILSLKENRDCTGRTSCNEGDVFYNTTDVLGLVCSPKFFMQDALVSTNASTGEITSYQLREPRDEIDIHTSVSAQWLYLSNPLDAKLQTIYGVTYKLPTGSPPVAAGYWIINAVEAISQSNITVDPFFTLLVDGQQQSSVEAYLQNPDRLQPDLETLGSNVLAEVVSAFAREAILLIPVVKIVAAGLYGVTMSVTTATVQPAVDTSIVTHLESTYDNGDSYLSVQRASQFAEWSRTPSLNVPRRAGILDNIVFSNLTSAGNFSQSQDLSNSTIDAEVPAISVDVKCTSVDMVLDAQYMDTRDCWNFSPNCDSQQCSDLIFAGDPSSYTNLQGDGGSCSGSRPPFVGLTGFGPSAYRVVLLDYSSIDGPITNVTPWGSTKNYTTYNLTTGTVGPSVLNVSLPTVLATSCALSLTAITLHTTYSFSPSDATWNPSSYAPSSIANTRPFNATALPSWLRPYAYAANGTALLDLNDLTLEAPGRLYSQSLWPTRGASLNFFELLAAHATYTLGDVRALLDRRNFTSAVEAMMAAYATEMLTEVRGAAAASAAAAPARIRATLRSAQSRIVQDRGSTVAVEALLALLLACVGWVFLRFPSEAVLPKSPGSVAARVSLLAGSGLVGELRARGAGRAKDVRGVTGRAGLGWWEGRGEEAVGERRRRWGVDVGEGVVHRGWNDPPVMAAPVEVEMVPVSPGRSLVSSMSSMSARGSDEELTGGAMRTRPGSESSGVTVISE
ncbi:hypothetical protein GTA08_BOTSDO04895 [Botryosphaeria dothidea]|uniref:Uncharacterized protein n=1 Tax=Botryosphaeria dothidea TaxID=55169 RepID=A0A8H4N3Z4_9PEZI|nr:hypothetical protein GTA08_BOTSDO04895 [Botryosphaeria dothidea]